MRGGITLPPHLFFVTNTRFFSGGNRPAFFALPVDFFWGGFMVLGIFIFWEMKVLKYGIWGAVALRGGVCVCV